MRPASFWYQSLAETQQKKRILDQYPWWTSMQKSSIKYWQTGSSSTSKSLSTMIKSASSLGCKTGSTYANQLIWYIIQQNGTNHMIISTDAEKVFDKIQHPFMLKTLKIQRIERPYLHTIKAIWNRPIVSITEWAKTESFFSKIWNKKTMLSFTTVIQYCRESPS